MVVSTGAATRSSARSWTMIWLPSSRFGSVAATWLLAQVVMPLS